MNTDLYHHDYERMSRVHDRKSNATRAPCSSQQACIAQLWIAQLNRHILSPAAGVRNCSLVRAFGAHHLAFALTLSKSAYHLLR